ncbi:MAG TPA: hypothetical protein VK699_18520 [Terriglobales bacterium]|jgi:hypothetical protein|nr:hypothetical protein [Terriglobales bacterium]
MKHVKICARRCALLVAAAALMLAMPSNSGAQQSPATYNINLALADEHVDDHGRTVITMMASGDLRGVLTLAISSVPDGTVTDGEWSLNVSYTVPLNPDAQPDFSLPDPDAAIGEQLIQRGVLSGTVTGGSITQADGQVAWLIGLRLSLTNGTVEFADVPNGFGTADGSNVNDRTNSAGSMTLTF